MGCNQKVINPCGHKIRHLTGLKKDRRPSVKLDSKLEKTV